MKAAVIDSPERGPRFADFAEPVVADGETLIEVTAAGLHPIVRMLASGEHYGSQGTLPMIPGIDGTGRSPDGTRVYFGGVRPPYGPMAQRAAASFVLPLPDGLDEVTAAAIINPGNGAWLALTRRAALQPGETVLVLGATGVSGRIAVALAARMGAGRVIAAGRNRVILDQLGATATVALGGPDDAAALADAAGQDGIHVIIDYLWGHPTEAAIAAITRRGMAHAAPRVRLVEVGQMAGPAISLPADVLRSSGLEILGSGPGTIPLAEIISAIPPFMAIAATGDLPIDLDEVPLAEVESAWQRSSGGGGPSSGPDYEPACGVQNGRIWTALISIRIQPETTQGLLRSEQRLDRCDSHQIFHGIGELPVERDQSVGLELGQSDVLGVKRVGPAELIGDLPCDDLKLVVFEQPDPHPAHVAEASLGILLGHLTAVYCLVEERQHLRAKKRRSQHVMPVGNHGLVTS